MKLVIVLAALILTACGAEPKHDEPRRIDAELAPLLDLFRADAESRGVQLLDVDLQRLELVDHTNAASHVGEAYCWDGVGSVLIATPEGDPKHAAFNLKRLVYHELGHCLRGLDHSGAFWSIMNATFTSIAEEDGTWERMSDEFWSLQK